MSSSFPCLSEEGLLFWGRVSHCLYERNVNEVTAVLFLSTWWCRGQASPWTAWKLTFSFRFLDLHVHCTHIHTGSKAAAAEGDAKGFWSFSTVSTKDLHTEKDLLFFYGCKTHKYTRKCICPCESDMYVNGFTSKHSVQIITVNYVFFVYYDQMHICMKAYIVKWAIYAFASLYFT